METKSPRSTICSSVQPAAERSFRAGRTRAGLVLFLAIVIGSSLGCGIIGGGDDNTAVEEGDKLRAQIQEELSAEAKTATKAESASEGDDLTDTDAEPVAETDGQPAEADAAAEAEAPAPVDQAEPVNPDAPVVVEDEAQARNLAWAHLSQCITFSADELEATLITGNWFVNGTAAASRDYGFWKIPSTSAMVSPHDTQAHGWESAINSQCSQESMAALPAQAKAIIGAEAAGTAVWSYLVQCVPDLSTEVFQSVLDPGRGRWTVVISPDQPNQLGTWLVAPDTGAVTPHTEPARLWDSAVRLGCTDEVLQPRLQHLIGAYRGSDGDRDVGGGDQSVVISSHMRTQPNRGPIAGHLESGHQRMDRDHYSGH